MNSDLNNSHNDDEDNGLKSIQNQERLEQDAEDDRLYYSTVASHIQNLIKREQALGTDYIKSLLTFSGGGIGLSITLVSGAFQTQLKHGFILLYISWIMFIACIILVLLYLKTFQSAFQEEILRINDEMESKKSISLRPYGGASLEKAAKCKKWALILFLIAIIFLLIFILINIELYNRNFIQFS